MTVKRIKTNKKAGVDKVIVDSGLYFRQRTEIVLKDIDMTIQKGEKVALIGTNGSGKTTILKIISKIETPNSGELSIRKNGNIFLPFSCFFALFFFLFQECF